MDRVHKMLFKKTIKWQKVLMTLKTSGLITSAFQTKDIKCHWKNLG